MNIYTPGAKFTEMMIKMNLRNNIKLTIITINTPFIINNLENLFLLRIIDLIFNDMKILNIIKSEEVKFFL